MLINEVFGFTSPKFEKRLNHHPLLEVKAVVSYPWQKPRHLEQVVGGNLWFRVSIIFYILI